MFNVKPGIGHGSPSNGLLWQVPKSGSTNPPDSGASRLNSRPNRAFGRRILAALHALRRGVSE